jgi:hypothetical protein
MIAGVPYNIPTLQSTLAGLENVADGFNSPIMLQEASVNPVRDNLSSEGDA